MAKRGRKEKDNWKKKRRQEYLEKKEFRYYIFCEGQATEPKYFQGFKRYIEDNPIYRDSCPNKTVVDEEELIEVLQEYFTNVLKQKKKVIAHVVNEFQRVYKAKDENIEYEKELNAELAKLQKTRQKYMDMYTDDLISREELNEKIGGSRQEMERIENELKMVSYHLTKGEQLENILNNTFKEIEDITDVHQMTNQQLKRLIQKIEVDKEGNVDIYLRLLGDLGLDESVLIEENETVLNCDDQT